SPLRRAGASAADDVPAQAARIAVRALDAAVARLGDVYQHTRSGAGGVSDVRHASRAANGRAARGPRVLVAGLAEHVPEAGARANPADFPLALGGRALAVDGRMRV